MLLDEIKAKCSPDQAAELGTLASHVAHVTEFDVRCAIWADDGSYLA